MKHRNTKGEALQMPICMCSSSRQGKEERTTEQPRRNRAQLDTNRMQIYLRPLRGSTWLRATTDRRSRSQRARRQEYCEERRECTRQAQSRQSALRRGFHQGPVQRLSTSTRASPRGRSTGEAALLRAHPIPPKQKMQEQISLFSSFSFSLNIDYRPLPHISYKIMKGQVQSKKYVSPFSKMFKSMIEEQPSFAQNISDLSTHLQVSQLKAYTELNLSQDPCILDMSQEGQRNLSALGETDLLPLAEHPEEDKKDKATKYYNVEQQGVFGTKNRLKTEIEAFHTPLKALYDDNFDISFSLAEMKRKINLQTDIDLEVIRQDYKVMLSQAQQQDVVQHSQHRQHQQQIDEVAESHQDIQRQIDALNQHILAVQHKVNRCNKYIGHPKKEQEQEQIMPTEDKESKSESKTVTQERESKSVTQGKESKTVTQQSDKQQ